MKEIITIVIVVLALLLSLTSLSGENSENIVEGEYLITVADERVTEEDMLNLFHEYEIKEVQYIQNNMYLLVFANDPGLKSLSETIQQTEQCIAIQRNHKYRVSPISSSQSELIEQ